MPFQPGNKLATKPGEDTRLSLRYNKANTELLQKAWQLEIKHNMTSLEYADWLRELCYNYPLNESRRIIAIYEEN